MLHEEALREQYREQARQIAVKIHTLDPNDGMQLTTDVERDVERYMEQRKADYSK
jgi:hypothetical protein